MKLFVNLFLINLLGNYTVYCLFPFETFTRTKQSLNGLWDFKVDFYNKGFDEQWYLKEFKSEVGLPVTLLTSSFFNYNFFNL